jgi:hypothetical protein
MNSPSSLFCTAFNWKLERATLSGIITFLLNKLMPYFLKTSFITFFSLDYICQLPHFCVLSYMLGAEPERSFINLKPRSCMHITYFSSLSCKSEDKTNALSISTISNVFRIVPNMKIFTCLNNGVFECQSR